MSGRILSLTEFPIMRTLFLALAAIAGTAALSEGVQAAPVALQPATIAATAATGDQAANAITTVEQARSRRRSRRYYRR